MLTPEAHLLTLENCDTSTTLAQGRHTNLLCAPYFYFIDLNAHRHSHTQMNTHTTGETGVKPGKGGLCQRQHPSSDSILEFCKTLPFGETRKSAQAICLYYLVELYIIIISILKRDPAPIEWTKYSTQVIITQTTYPWIYSEH